MNQEETLKKLNKILSKHLKIPVEKITDDVSYETESNWDSVTHLKMIADIEETFKTNFAIDDVVSLEDVGKIREMVLKKTKNS